MRLPTRDLADRRRLFGIPLTLQRGYTPKAAIVPNLPPKGKAHEPSFSPRDAELVARPSSRWSAEPNTDRAKAIAQIKKLGGHVTVAENDPCKSVITD